MTKLRKSIDNTFLQPWRVVVGGVEANVRTTGRRAGGRGWGACPWRPGAGWRRARRRSGTTAPPAGGTPVLMRRRCPGGCTKYTIHTIQSVFCLQGWQSRNWCDVNQMVLELLVIHMDLICKIFHPWHIYWGQTLCVAWYLLMLQGVPYYWARFVFVIFPGSRAHTEELFIAIG